MMTNEKTAFIQQMEKQRFLPITGDTQRLYDSFREQIDGHDPDELSYLLFYEGEFYYRTGDFNQSLNYLNRCLQSPKKAFLKYLDARSYNIIGLIYSYLGQENIAISYLIFSKTLCDELQLGHESTICSINLAGIYGQLEVFDTALDHYAQALISSRGSLESNSRLTEICTACRGILFCKMGRFEDAGAAYEAIRAADTRGETLYSNVCTLSLRIRLFAFDADEVNLRQNLERFLTLISSDSDFIEICEFYFDICAFLLEKKMQQETLMVLSYIGNFAEHSPLAFLRNRYLSCYIHYTREFSTYGLYLEACSQFIVLRRRYQTEQCSAKLYSLAYTERLHQTKNASELYREKSRIDQMTGLLNKYTIRFLVEEDLAKASQTKQSALILIDLDHFKQINDTFGHMMGDTFICQTGSIIQNYFKDNALCGRVGGDEFLVYISDATDRTSIILQTEILKQEIHRQTSERNITVTTQASIGIAFSSEYCYDYESLFSAADHALYHAKMEGRNKVVVAG